MLRRVSIKVLGNGRGERLASPRARRLQAADCRFHHPSIGKGASSRRARVIAGASHSADAADCSRALRRKNSAGDVTMIAIAPTFTFVISPRLMMLSSV